MCQLQSVHTNYETFKSVQSQIEAGIDWWYNTLCVVIFLSEKEGLEIGLAS